MIRPKTKTENILLSSTKNSETLFEQTHRKAEETLEFKMIKPRETIHFNSPVQYEEDGMIGLTDSEVYNSLFIINTTNKKFKLNKIPDKKTVGDSYERVRDGLKKTWIFRIIRSLIYKMIL